MRSDARCARRSKRCCARRVRSRLHRVDRSWLTDLTDVRRRPCVWARRAAPPQGSSVGDVACTIRQGAIGYGACVPAVHADAWYRSRLQMSDDDDPLLGTTVAGRFRLVERIGRGGMGAVYRAVQSPLERECALKLIRNDVVDALARKRFEREARIAASIHDPRVATVYDFGSTDDGTLFLAMELVHGVTLRHRLQQ